MLVRQEMVRSAQGTKGGFLLQQNPKEIDLQEIYCAIEDRKAFHLDVSKSSGESKNRTAMFNNYFLDFFTVVQVEIENKMRKMGDARIVQQDYRLLKSMEQESDKLEKEIHRSVHQIHSLLEEKDLMVYD